MEPRSTVSRGLELTPDLLAVQGRALRRLACSLLGDEHAAEDVVQETWLACLRPSAALPERVSSWLGTVTRRLAWHRVRGERRRHQREKRAAAPERQEALELRTREREEAVRAVTQALLSLQEPFKTALFLRFYEDLTPSAIALELGEPLATVKSRLARGARADCARGSRPSSRATRRGQHALLVLAGAPPSAPIVGTQAAGTAAAGSAVATMGIAWKLSLAAAGLFLAGASLSWWSRVQERRSESGRGVPPGVTRAALELAPGGESTVQSSASVTSGDGSRREPVSSVEAKPGPGEALPAEAFTPERYPGQVRDERDALCDAHVSLAPHGFPMNRVATTDGEGRFAIAFDGRRRG
jgi:RNA polymerase sigma-70 factor (ECF subfamily)